jgi:hypothetical protein
MLETTTLIPPARDQLIEAIRAKWALLREEKYVGDYPVKVLRSADTNGDVTKIVEILWYSGQANFEVEASERYRALFEARWPSGANSLNRSEAVASATGSERHDPGRFNPAPAASRVLTT